MKIILLLLVLMTHYGCAQKPQTVELNSENIALLALNYSPKPVLDNYVLDLVKSQHAQVYYPISRDKQKVQLLLSKYSEQILQQAAQLSDKTDFSLEQTVYFSKFDESKTHLVVKSFLLGNSLPITNSQAANNGMPANFLLLIPNTHMLNDFSVEAKKFNNMLSARTNKLDKSLFMQVIVNLVKFQNQDNFQTVIKQVNLYASPAKKILLATKTETANSADLIADWLLSDGYTNKLIGIHAFSFFGYRLQDQLRTASSKADYCHKTTKLGIHQVLVCQRKSGDNFSVIGTFIGGIVAQIDLVAHAALTEKDKKIVMQNLHKDLNQTNAIINQTHKHWNKYGVDFDFYNDAFFGKKSEQSNYHNGFATSAALNISGLTLIASMISHETQQLIEENK